MKGKLRFQQLDANLVHWVTMEAATSSSNSWLGRFLIHFHGLWSGNHQACAMQCRRPLLRHYQETVSMRRLPQRIQTRARLIRSTKETNIQISIHQFRISIHNHINNIQLVCMFFKKNIQVTALSAKNDSNFWRSSCFGGSYCLSLLEQSLVTYPPGIEATFLQVLPQGLTAPRSAPFLGFPSCIGKFCQKNKHLKDIHVQYLPIYIHLVNI